MDLALKIGILGAGEMGGFHIREFINFGSNIVAILGRTKESSRKTSTKLKKLWNIDVKPYDNLEEMINTEQIDAVSICTPQKLHEGFTEKCLEKGLHVLCEKPLIVNPQDCVYQKTKELIELAKYKNRILTVNTPWPSILKKFNLTDSVKEFEVYVEPGEIGKHMLLDYMPHTNSLLMRLIPNGTSENIKFTTKRDREIKVEFDYKNQKDVCKVKYHFKYNPDRPRAVEFSFNGKKFQREIGEGYKQRFKTDSEEIEIDDPLSISIQNFVDAVKGKGNPLISEEEILESARLQDQIILNYLK